MRSHQLAGGSDEADRRRLLGLLRRPGLRRLLLPARGRRGRSHLAGAARPRERRARLAAAVRRPARPSTRCCSPTCTPTTTSTSAGSTSCGSTTPTGLPAIPVWGPPASRTGGARLRPPPGPRDDRRVRLPRVRRAGPHRTVPVEPVPLAHPVAAYGLRVTADGRTLVYSGDTGPCERRRPARRGCGPAARRGVVRRDGEKNPGRPAPDRPRGRRRSRPPGAPGWCSPTFRRGTTPTTCRPRRRRCTTAS